MSCAYCGRLAHRCRCGLPDSQLSRFLARGGQSYKPKLITGRARFAVPPQVKRRERATLRANHAAWHAQLVDKYGDKCANCGAGGGLALDHVLPIARGGRSELENLQLLCATCNGLKGKLMVDCRTPSP